MSRPVFGRLPAACGAAVAAELPVPEAPALPEPDEEPLEPEPEVCGLGDSGWMLPPGVVWALEPLDPLDPEPADPELPDPEPPNGSWYC
ncbi:MAG: hypothetical protein JWR30_1261 [Conexibacter sp.]|nr:hypothetical protein [Conexibacter sp.]